MNWTSGQGREDKSMCERLVACETKVLGGWSCHGYLVTCVCGRLEWSSGLNIFMFILPPVCGRAVKMTEKIKFGQNKLSINLDGRPLLYMDLEVGKLTSFRWKSHYFVNIVSGLI
jgi:hypothetical protein